MSDIEDAVLAIKQFGGQYQPSLPYWVAYLGDGRGNVRTNSANYSLCRYPLSSSTPFDIYNTRVQGVDNLRVYIGYLPHMPKQLQVIDVVDQRLEQTQPDGSIVVPIYANVVDHANNHAYLGVDPVYVNWRQITPLGVFPTYPVSMLIQIRAGYIPRPGADTWVNDQTVDLTSHVPGSGARYVLVSFDAAGNVTLTDGPIGTDFASLTAADIPDTPAGDWRSAAVLLYAGQSAVVENRSEIDIYDLRFPEEQSAGGLTLALTNAHIFVGDAGGIAADVALSGDATIANTGALSLAASGVTAGTYGDSTHAPQVTFDAKGRATAASSIALLRWEPVTYADEVLIYNHDVLMIGV